SFLISKIWEYRNSKFTLEDSLKYAIQYCIDNNVLRDFLRKHGSEVYSMLYGEYRIEDEIAVVKEEVREEEKRTIARNLLVEGSTPEFIQKITGLSLEEISKL
ncbi:MAG: hypothetical protein FWD26_09705, partial [Treponema sp.]|nr:hypothetical protein [Treponema sp.]